MEGEGAGSGEVKVDLVENGGGVTSAEEKGVRSVEENVEEKMESGEQEDVKLQIEDDPEAGTEEGRKEREKEGEKEESERGGEEKVGNLDTDNYQGLVQQLRLEFGKGQKISHAIVIIHKCHNVYSFF